MRGQQSPYLLLDGETEGGTTITEVVAGQGDTGHIGADASHTDTYGLEGGSGVIPLLVYMVPLLQKEGRSKQSMI